MRNKKFKQFPAEIKNFIQQSQINEITEYFVYQKLAQAAKKKHNQDALKKIADDELKHYNAFKQYSREEIKPNKLKVWKYFWMARMLGLTFGVKLMEQGEAQAQINYQKLEEYMPEIKEIIHDENSHEKALIDLIDEEKLKYVGSIVLGLNDALVEITGTLAGFTFALQNSKLIALTGLIMGVAASLSMAASEYLATKAEKNGNDPLKSAISTGIAYVLTVFFLVSPYFLLENFYLSLFFTVLNGLIIILIFNFYISVVQALSFRKRFFEMAFISLGVATLSFGIGALIRYFLGVEV